MAFVGGRSKTSLLGEVYIIDGVMFSGRLMVDGRFVLRKVAFELGRVIVVISQLHCVNQEGSIWPVVKTLLP